VDVVQLAAPDVQQDVLDSVEQAVRQVVEELAELDVVLGVK